MAATSRIRTFLFWFLSFGVALASLRFLIGGVEATMQHMLYHALERQWAFYAHVTLGPLALVLAPFQFWKKLRLRRPNLHRWMGRTYALAILLAGLGGLLMAIGTQAGTFAGIGFGLLALVWLYTTGRAVWLAMQGKIAAHRQWMIRSAAVTLSAVTLRLYLPILAATLGFETGYPLVAWLCWVPNVIVAEWLIWRENRPERFGWEAA